MELLNFFKRRKEQREQNIQQMSKVQQIIYNIKLTKTQKELEKLRPQLEQTVLGLLELYEIEEELPDKQNPERLLVRKLLPSDIPSLTTNKLIEIAENGVAELNKLINK